MFLRDGSGELHREAVYQLAKKIEAGDDLTPFLSDRIARFGYVSSANKRSKSRGVEWQDKDYALNAFDTHHLHLKPAGTKALLYVCFSRDHAFLVMLGDHKSFDDGTLAQALEGDRVALIGQSFGLITYESVLGSRTVPRIYAYQVVIVPRGDPMPLGQLQTAPPVRPIPPGEISTPYDELNRGNAIERK